MLGFFLVGCYATVDCGNNLFFDPRKPQAAACANSQREAETYIGYLDSTQLDFAKQYKQSPQLEGYAFKAGKIIKAGVVLRLRQGKTNWRVFVPKAKSLAAVTTQMVDNLIAMFRRAKAAYNQIMSPPVCRAAVSQNFPAQHRKALDQVCQRNAPDPKVVFSPVVGDLVGELYKAVAPASKNEFVRVLTTVKSEHIQYCLDCLTKPIEAKQQRENKPPFEAWFNSLSPGMQVSVSTEIKRDLGDFLKAIPQDALEEFAALVIKKNRILVFPKKFITFFQKTLSDGHSMTDDMLSEYEKQFEVLASKPRVDLDVLNALETRFYTAWMFELASA